MILHLLGLTLIPHLLQAFSSSFVDICSFSKTRSISVGVICVSDVVDAHVAHLDSTV